MARIYVAAKFEDALFARAVMGMLALAGHEITHDWTNETIEGKRGLEVLDTYQEAAVADADGVKTADALVLIHHDNLRGGLVELGVALGCEIPVIIVGGAGWSYPLPFYVHPDVIHVANADDALVRLEQLFPGEQCCGDCAGCKVAA